MNRTGSAESDASESLASHLGGVMVPALGWSSEIAVRFGHVAGIIPTLVAALGSTALTLGSVAMVTRRSRAAGVDAIVIGALLSSGPIGVSGAVIGDKTHHRALGGVTFAFVAAVLVVAGFLVARRMLSISSRAKSLARVVLTILVVSSTSVVVLPLLREWHPSSSMSRFVAQDLAVGGSLVALVVARLGWAPRARAARAAAVLWVLSVVVGSLVLAANMPLRAMLALHAPVALGPFGLGLGIRASGPLPGVPSRVDVSLH